MSERNFGIKYGSILGLILSIFFWVIGPEKIVPMPIEEDPSFIDLYLARIILIGFLIYILIFFRIAQQIPLLLIWINSYP